MRSSFIILMFPVPVSLVSIEKIRNKSAHGKQVKNYSLLPIKTVKIGLSRCISTEITVLCLKAAIKHLSIGSK